MAEALSIPALGEPQSKTCTKCGETKPIGEFSPSAKGLFGRHSRCRVCHRAAVRAGADRHRRSAGKPVLGAPMNCEECGNECVRTNANQRYCGACCKIVERRRAKAAGERYRKDNPRARLLRRKAVERHREKNLDRLRTEALARSKRPEIMERARVRARRLRRDPKVAVHVRMSAGIRSALRLRKGGRRWEGIVGYSLAELVVHLERQFMPGMGWHNIDQWEIDHIIPRSSFLISNANDPEFRACWALTNLRPLWADANRIKSGKRLFLI